MATFLSINNHPYLITKILRLPIEFIEKILADPTTIDKMR